MIPTVQFDPATLAIWTTTGSLTEPLASHAEIALRLAMGGKDVSEALGDFPHGNPLRARLLWLASAVWHEKRHYFDTCLTNYGARRFRDLFNLAVNFYPLIAQARHKGEPVWFPVEVYGDAVQRRVLGISEPPPNILEISRKTRMMKDLAAELEKPIGKGEDILHLGGESQMEGLAQVCQLHAIESNFGIEDLLTTTFEYVHALDRKGPYRTIEAVAGVLGCSREVETGTVVVNPGLAGAMFFTALSGRFYGLGPTPPITAVQPMTRLAQMIDALGTDSGRFEMPDEESAEMVDKLAQRLWGRTAFEEIAADIDAMEARVNLESAPWLAVEGLYDAFTDFIALRRRLLDAVRRAGSSSVMPRAFPVHWQDRLLPWHVEACPSGADADDEADQLIFRSQLNLPDELRGAYPSAVGFARLQIPDRTHPFSLHDEGAWRQMLEIHGPRALLMLNGRQHRLMVPVELERSIRETQKLDVEVRFHHRFAWPENRHPLICGEEAAALANFSGRDSFVCDVTGDQISPSEAVVLTPWEFRRSGLDAKFRENAGPLGEIQLHIDWSDWIVRRDLLN
jgi:hypothetical protein